MVERIKKQMDGWMDGLKTYMKKQLDGWMAIKITENKYGWLKGYKNKKRIDGWLDG